MGGRGIQNQNTVIPDTHLVGRYIVLYIVLYIVIPKEANAHYCGFVSVYRTCNRYQKCSLDLSHGFQWVSATHAIFVCNAAIQSVLHCLTETIEKVLVPSTLFTYILATLCLCQFTKGVAVDQFLWRYHLKVLHFHSDANSEAQRGTSCSNLNVAWQYLLITFILINIYISEHFVFTCITVSYKSWKFGWMKFTMIS